MRTDATPDNEEIYTYDKNGKLVRIDEYQRKKNPDKITFLEYDVNGNLNIEKKCDAANNILVQTDYTYDTNNTLLKKKQWFKNINFTAIERYDYNSRGEVTVITKETPTEISREQYKYNSSGNVIEKSEYNAKNQHYSTLLYEYNIQGDKTGLYKLNVSGEMTYFEQYEYQYDEKDNWTEKKIFIKGDWKSVEKREIKYF